MLFFDLSSRQVYGVVRFNRSYNIEGFPSVSVSFFSNNFVAGTNVFLNFPRRVTWNAATLDSCNKLAGTE